MLMPIEELLATYGEAPVTGILHVGAHLAEEAATYDVFDVPVWWVEANPGVMRKLQRIVARWPQQQVIHALVTDGFRETKFNVTNYDGMSSSIFEFGTHKKDSPDTVYLRECSMLSTTIDWLAAEYQIEANLLNLDIQGAELLALRGAEKFLEGVEYLYTEVSTGQVYVGGAWMHQLDDYLTDRGFKRVETNLGMHRGTHGDAFYRRIK